VRIQQNIGTPSLSRERRIKTNKQTIDKIDNWDFNESFKTTPDKKLSTSSLGDLILSPDAGKDFRIYTPFL